MSWGETLFLKKIIDGKKTFAPSNNDLVVFNNTKNKDWEKGEIIGVFKAKAGGQIKLESFGRHRTSLSDVEGYINVEVDGLLVGYLVFDSTSKQIVSTTLNIDKGKVYTIKARDTGFGVETDYVKFCATIIDGSLFEIEQTT